ncbi:hypothetical protein GCM10023321_14380 [Pseudonocardia eucalypti]|uniref:Uncharacterized protein n=1 Tax=Pseudonocardia eucalypti TaxID=648755 RepID=A0ABP9PP97_9PSEU|nr:hypothetical protein [Pseudonocardia eucalypti]
MLRGLVGPGGSARWEDAPASARHRLLALILAPEWLGELQLLRSPNSGGRDGCPAKDPVTWRRNDRPVDSPAAVA